MEKGCCESFFCNHKEQCEEPGEGGHTISKTLSTPTHFHTCASRTARAAALACSAAALAATAFARASCSACGKGKGEWGQCEDERGGRARGKGSSKHST